MKRRTVSVAVTCLILGMLPRTAACGFTRGFIAPKGTGKKLTRYTYEIENYEGYDGKVYANLITYRDRIVGADLTGTGVGEGFVKPLQ